MKRSSVNLKRLRRSALPLICILIFLLSSGGFMASLEISRVGAPGKVRADDVKEKEVALGPGESGCTDANFTAAATSPEAVGVFPQTVAVGDFNRDGHPDLATANAGSDNVSILL